MGGTEHLTVRREGTFLWYAANTPAIEQLLKFLFAECCTRASGIRNGSQFHVERGMYVASLNAGRGSAGEAGGPGSAMSSRSTVPSRSTSATDTE